MPTIQISRPLSPVVVGGLVGAGLYLAHRQGKHQTLTREQLDQLIRLQEAQATKASQLLKLAQAEARQQAQARSYQRDLLWLEHADNVERLQYILEKSRSTLVSTLAKDLVAGTEIDSLLNEFRAENLRLRQQQAELEKQERALVAALAEERQALGIAGILFCPAVFAVIMGPILWILCGVFLILSLSKFTLLVYAATFACLAGHRLFQRRRRHALCDTHTTVLSELGNRITLAKRLEQTIEATRQEISSIEVTLASHLEQHRRHLHSLAPCLAERAAAYSDEIRAVLDAFQQIYPPRLRFEGSSIPTSLLLGRLAHLLVAGLIEDQEKLNGG